MIGPRPTAMLLLTASLSVVLVMILHPTAHDITSAATPGQPAAVSSMVHGLAIAALSALFLGLLGVRQVLGGSGLATAGVVAWGTGAVAGVSAAVMSGFVGGPVAVELAGATADTRVVTEALLFLTGAMNQGFAKVLVVGNAAGIALLGAAITRQNVLSRWIGIGGALVGAGVLVAFYGGLRLGVQGFGAITFVESAWMSWLGFALWRLTARPRPVGDRGAQPG